MRPIFVRELTDREMDELFIILEDEKIGYRAKIILLSNEGYTVPEIRMMTNRHDNNIRKWIHRFNDEGISGITPVRRSENNVVFTKEDQEKIVEIAKQSPRELGLKFSNWSLRTLTWYLKDREVVETISHETVRTILIEAGVRFRRSRKELKSTDPEYEIKKKSS